MLNRARFRRIMAGQTVLDLRWTASQVLLVLQAVLVVVLGSEDPRFSEFRFRVQPSDSIAVRDRPALLNCSVEHSGDSVQISWLRDGVIMNFDGDTRRHILSNGSLYFSTVEHTRSHRPDEAVFQCMASVRGLGTIVSQKAHLQVAYLAKSFVEEPQDLSVHLGDTAMFTCIMEGAPKPEVRWYRDDVEISTDDSRYYIQDTVLEILSVRFADFGRYKCQVENVERSRMSRTATLSQTSSSTYQSLPPAFIMQPKSQTAVEGSTLRLFCEANGLDRQNKQPTITWLKDGITIDMEESDSRLSIIGKGSLQMKDIMESDAGTYTCRSTNQEDSVDAVATISVHVAPRFVKEPSNIFAHENADVEFECEVYGNPEPSIQWRKNGDIVFPSDYFQIIDNHNLRILGLVDSDAGLYQCIAENEVGNIEASGQLVILQQDVPLPIPLLTTPQHHHTGSAGNTSPDHPSPPRHLSAAVISTRFVTLSWSLPSDLGSSEVTTYSVFWKEVGSERERVLNTTNLEANIQHLKAGTQYEFRVLAYNNAGPSQQAARIRVQTQLEANVPDPASSLQVEALSPTSIKATWGAPIGSSGGDITHYQLFYYEVGEEEEHDVTVNGHQHTLTGLKKFVQYSFRVVAHNSNGPGVSTDEVLARTYSDAPSEPPQNVTVETSSSDMVEIQWEPPSENARNGIITGYKIRSKKRRADGGSTITTDGNHRSYALTDLQRGAEYQIRLQAMTVNGSGPATDWIMVETLQHDVIESDVPGSPWGLQVRPFADEIMVSWNPPRNKRVLVRGYTLGYGMNIPDIYQKVLDAKERIYTIKNLQPASQYVIRLRAFNNMGEGQSVYENVFTREPTEPEHKTPMMPPVGLHAQVLSSTSVLLTWSDSTLGRNQRITDNRFYSIRYQPRAARKFKIVNSTDLNMHIDELKPSTDYEFSVKVWRGRRESTWSLSVFNKTFEDSPTTAPRDLTPVPVDKKPTWVTLNWQPPRQPNGRITGYVVFYTTDNTQPDRRWAADGVLGDRLSYTVKDLSPETTYFFKIQARNSKGYGPMSPTVIFRTPALDGTGGGMIETPNDWGRTPDEKLNGPNAPYYPEEGPRSQDEKKGKKKGGIPPLVLWVSIGLVGAFTVVAVIVITAIMCKRRMADAERKKRKGYHPANKAKSGPNNLKPPDLWIHHEQMELKSLGEKPGQESVGLVHNSSQELAKSMDDVQSGTEMDRRRNSFISERKDERYHHNQLRPKPIMIPVDQPPPPREPIATATAVPNGHLNHEKMVTVVAPTPIRPVYPRTQYQGHYSSTPRVNAGDLSQPSSENNPHLTSTMERRKAKSDKMRKQSNSCSKLTGPQSPESPSSHAPIPYEQLHHASTPPGGAPQHQYPGGAPPTDGTKSLPHRSPHPLRSFSVPGPPPGSSAPSTPVPKHNIVRPQQQQQQQQPPAQQQQQKQPPSPYKKPPPPSGVSSGKARSPMPVISPRAPDVIQRGSEGDQHNHSDLQKSFSTEELTAEMANLEGLMKDLNAITQQEFEC